MHNEAKQRETNHAKLLQHEQRQVVAFLYRDSDDALCVALQLWVAVTDEQLRAVIQGETDEQTLGIFETLTDETIGHALHHMNIINDIERLEEALA